MLYLFPDRIDLRLAALSGTNLLKRLPNGFLRVTIQYGLVLVAKSQEAPEKNRERTKWAFRHLDESLLKSYSSFKA
jgi:hypothetical protein